MKRLLIAATATLLLAACGTAEGETTSTPSSAAAAPIQLIVRDMAIDPGELSVPAGEVALAVTNEGPTPHNVRIRDANGDILFGTSDLRRDESETATGTLEAGEYTMFCSLPGHESLGVVGTLTVREP